MGRRILLIFVILASFSLGYSQRVPPIVPPFGPSTKSIEVLRELNLTLEQVRRIREVNRKFRPQILQAREKLQKANDSLNEAIYADSLNEKLVEERLKAFQEAYSNLTRLRIEAEVELRKILTQEQLEKFRQIRQKNPERRRFRFTM